MLIVLLQSGKDKESGLSEAERQEKLKNYTPPAPGSAPKAMIQQCNFGPLGTGIVNDFRATSAKFLLLSFFVLVF